MLTDKQKDIYNLYIQAIAYGAQRPYKKREDFSTFKNEENAIYLAKLELFFNNFPHLCNVDFFTAPYKLYAGERTYYTLKFYAGHKGLTTCLAYLKTVRDSDPDDQLDYIKESIRFISKFCIDNKISLDMYVSHKSVAQPDYLIHLKTHKISFYVIFAVPNMYYSLLNLPEDEFELYFGTDIDIDALMVRYNSSKITKNFLNERVPLVATHIRKCLNA